MELLTADSFAFGYSFIECAIGAVVVAAVIYCVFRFLGR